MFRKKGKPSTETVSSPSIEKVENFNDSIESHQMTLNRPFGVAEAIESASCQIEYHLTIRIINESLSRRELGLLLDVLNYQAVHYGVNLNMMMAIYEIYFRLLGNKTSSKDIRESHIRLTLTVSELILRILKKREFSLDSKYILEIPSQLKSILMKGLMSKRTYGSRYRTWRPEKYLKVQIVPVDIQFLSRKVGTQPYSSYCKGYGESHPSAHKKSLKPSAEYNGSGEDPFAVEELKLFERCTNPIHLLSEYLLIWYSNEVEEEK